MLSLYLLSITTSMIFMFLKHPLSMGITIITQTVIIAMITGIMMNSFWFSYILFITMLSGILILFIYMASVASNEKFYTSFKLIMLSTLMIMISISMLLHNPNTENKMNECMISVEELIMVSLFNNNHMLITISLAMYLLFTMIVVSYISYTSEGPLRTKN